MGSVFYDLKSLETPGLVGKAVCLHGKCKTICSTTPFTQAGTAIWMTLHA